MSKPSTAAIFKSLWADGHPSKSIRLRFELGGEEYENLGEQVPRFLQAHRRACAIADFVFKDECIGIVAWPDKDARGTLVDGQSGFDALMATGFRASICDTWEADLFGTCGGSPWTIRSYDLKQAKIQRDILLWHAIAREMPIEPSVNVVSFFLHPTRELLLYAYDDRGMDLTGAHSKELFAAYERFDGWLLDHDRARAAEIFQR